MNATDLDQTYRALARAIDQSAMDQSDTDTASPNGSNLSKSELFLAMLSLKLISQLPDAQTAETIITQILTEAKKPSASERSVDQTKSI
jgi:hypothetical protein